MNKQWFVSGCAFLASVMVFSSSAHAANAAVPVQHGVSVNDAIFAGKQVTVLLSGRGTAHKEIKNQKYSQDYWILQSPKVVQIGHNSYLKGRAVNGPINFKSKVVWIELSKVQIIREN